MPGGNPRRDRVGRHRAADEETLCALASELQQHLALLHTFHALGNDLVVKSGGEADHRFEYGQVVAPSSMSPTKLRSILICETGRFLR